MKQITFKQKVVQGIYDLFYVWKQELRNLFRDQGVLIFFVLVPLISFDILVHLYQRNSP